MSREYPDWISPGRAAEGKRVFSGTIPFSRMKRLSRELVDAKGEASFTASFSIDLENNVIIDLRVQAALPLVCQASLEVYDEMVNRRSKLAVIDNESQQDDLPDIYEPVMTENGRLAIASLGEDELLLALPQVPRKPGLKPPDPQEKGQSSGSQKTYKPFAGLEELLKSPETEQDSESN